MMFPKWYLARSHTETLNHSTYRLLETNCIRHIGHRCHISTTTTANDRTDSATKVFDRKIHLHLNWTMKWMAANGGYSFAPKSMNYFVSCCLFSISHSNRPRHRRNYRSCCRSLWFLGFEFVLDAIATLNWPNVLVPVFVASRSSASFCRTTLLFSSTFHGFPNKSGITKRRAGWGMEKEVKAESGENKKKRKITKKMYKKEKSVKKKKKMRKKREKWRKNYINDVNPWKCKNL